MAVRNQSTWKIIVVVLTTCTGYALLIATAFIAITGCPHPPTPDPVYPETTDAPVEPKDAPPANCASFAGKYAVVDNAVPADLQTCKPKTIRDIIHIEVIGTPDPDSGQWDVTVIGESGIQWIGLAKQLEDRPYICRFVVEFQGTPTGTTVVNRDFIFGEQPGKGIGEALVKSGDCLWQSATVLTAVP